MHMRFGDGVVAVRMMCVLLAMVLSSYFFSFPEAALLMFFGVRVETVGVCPLFIELFCRYCFVDVLEGRGRRAWVAIGTIRKWARNYGGNIRPDDMFDFLRKQVKWKCIIIRSIADPRYI